MSVSGTAGQPGQHVRISRSLQVGQPPQQREGMIAEDVFADLLASRQALASASRSPADDETRSDAAPAAGEFAATTFFRTVELCDDKSGKFANEAVNLRSEVPDTGPEAKPEAATIFVGDADAGTSGAADAGQEAPGVTTILTESRGFNARRGHFITQIALTPLSASGEQLSGRLQSLPLFRATTVEPDPAESTGRPARTVPRQPGRIAPVAVSLSTEGSQATVTTRVADLNPEEARQLDRRIREELGSARLSVRDIKTNGRRSRPITEE